MSESLTALKELDISPESMDLIIDDGPHSLHSQEVFLQVMFSALKPGGYYVMEDVYGEGLNAFRDQPESALSHKTFEILSKNDAFFVDATTGHRDWDAWKYKNSWVKARNNHNSNMVIIRRRSL